MNERYALTFDTMISMDVLKKKLTKIKESLDLIHPSGNYTIESCHLDKDMCIILQHPTTIPILLNNVFGNKYKYITRCIMDEMLKESMADNNRYITKKYNKQHIDMREEILNYYLDELLFRSREKLFCSEDYQISKVFVITNGELNDYMSRN